MLTETITQTQATEPHAHAVRGTTDGVADAFRANPHATLRRVMNRSQALSYGHAAGALALPAPERGDANHGATARLAGDIRVTRNPTSTRGGQSATPDLDCAPTKRNLAAIIAAEHLAHDLLATGMPDTLAAQADTIAAFLEPVILTWARSGLDRRGPMFAEAAARYLTTWAQPTHLRFAAMGPLRRWYADQAELAAELSDVPMTNATVDEDGEGVPGGTRPGLALSFMRRPRAVWTHPDGPDHGLMLDRFHHAPRAGMLERDSWTHRKVAEDLRAAATFLAPATSLQSVDGSAPRAAILGVRVLTHLAPNAGRHFLPAYVHGSTVPVLGASHRLGDCTWCATTTHLPNTQPAAADTRDATTTAQVLA